MPAGGGGGGLSGFSKPAETSWSQWFELGNILSIGLGSIGINIPRIGISLGYPVIPVFRPRISFPDLVEQTVINTQTTGVSVATTGAAKPPDQKDETGFFDPKVGKMITQGTRGWIYAGIEYVTKAAATAASLGQAGVLAASSIIGPVETVKPAAILPEAVTGGDDMGLDLGNLLGNLGGAYIQAKFGGGAAGVIADPGGVYTNPTGPPAGGTRVLEGGFPGFDVIPEGSKGRCWSPSANCGAGGWIKKRRRRRRRLATASDIRDLSALRDTVGPAMTKTWIATHPS